jgi:hypothetical protein
VRIAERRSWSSRAVRQQRHTTVLALVLAVAAAVAVAVPVSTFGGSTDAPPRAARDLTMADALGIGGLSGLRLDDGFDGSEISALSRDQVVAYYGTPRQPSMGILGEHEAETIAWLLRERAARFDALNGDAGVLPALHLVYAVAQPETTSDGLYLRYVDDRTVRSYLSLARRNGFALVLDLQVGHSTALAETQKVLPYLEEPDVHLALDPEFALAGREKPGEAIGSLDASDINAVQWLLETFTEERGLPKKMLIVHQFESSMISNALAIERRDGVDLVIDMDGYGPADVKAVKYQRYGAAPYAPFGGIKLFLRHDPDLMAEHEILGMRPRPAFILYQ